MRIKEHRLKLRMRAKDVANKMGMRLREYLDIEYKERELTLSEYYKLIAILRIQK